MPRKSRSTKSKKMRGGRVVFPSEYYGVASGRYHDTGSPNLQACTNAYGQALARSFGTGNLSDGFVGPNMGPSPSSSFVQTGGSPKKSKRVRFRSRSQSPRRNRNRSQVRRRTPTPPPRRNRNRSKSRSRSRSPSKNRVNKNKNRGRARK